MVFKFSDSKNLLVILCIAAATIQSQSKKLDPSTCNLSQKTKDEIKSYLPIVEQLRNAIEGPFKHKTYDDLDEFIDFAGPRVSGSKGVERAINFLTDKMRQPDSGVKTIRKEAVNVLKPTIGTEFAEMILPRKKELAILNERWRRNTPEEGILSKVVVFKSIEELRKKRLLVFGKIVLLNFPSDNHGLVQRTNAYFPGIREAAEMGALAVLLRSVTPFSLYTLVEYAYLNEDVELVEPPLPVATLTVEDTELLTRIAKRGQEIVIRMVIRGYSMGRGTSYNVISDYEGTKFSDQYVIISGHLDNSKVGLGVQDDGFALLQSLNTIRLLKSLNLRPKYTLRVIFWTGEEYGLFGPRAFAKAHSGELADGRYRAALEADTGCEGLPRLAASNGSPEFYCILNEILFTLLNYKPGYSSSVLIQAEWTDVFVLREFGVPFIIFAEDRNGSYDGIRHSAGDMMTAIKPKDLDTCLLVYTTIAYILSDMDTPIKLKG